MTAFRLPVSGIEVALRPPGGAEDVFLAEAGRYQPQLAQTLVQALARPADGSTLDWTDVTLTDLDATLLAIRSMVLGERIASSARCTPPARAPSGSRDAMGCGASIDLGFGVAEYLAQHRPHAPRGVTRCDDPAWYALDRTGARFRLPTHRDLAAIAAEPDPEVELARRCIEPHTARLHVRRRIEHAMEALAPNLYGTLEGVCPECSATVRIAFDPQRYVIEELRQRAAFVFEEVHLIAERYRWSEPAILAMPHARRARYAALIHDARSGA